MGTRVALASALGGLGLAVAACAGLLSVDGVLYRDASAEIDAGDGGDGGDGGCKTCVVCVDADDPSVGCANPTNCRPCPGPANGAATCVAGACGVACTGSFANCNGDAVDGCEVDLSSGDPSNCGRCGHACEGGTLCDKGECAVSCQGGELTCDGGCFDPSSSTAHCGSCGTSCSAGANASPTCTGGACTFTCSSGYLDCNGDAGDGCEVPPSDVDHCGSCTRVCPHNNAKPVCQGGACSYTCDLGFYDCDGLAGNGCECDITGNNCVVGTGQCKRCVGLQGDCLTGIECCNGGDTAAVTCGTQPSQSSPVCCLNAGYPCLGVSARCCSGKCVGGLCEN